MRVFLSNLGCKLNQAEIERMARGFLARGHEIVASLDEADLQIVNSCAVTQTACRSSRKAARRGPSALHARPRTVLTGCYATAFPDEARALPGVDLVVPNASKDQLVALVHDAFVDELLPLPPELPIPYTPLEPGHARATVKIGDGCNLRCAFCIIPSTRGRERYRGVDEILEEVRELVDGGYREVVLTGVQISSYTHGSACLVDLVEAILEQTSLERLRLTSIAPWNFDDRLLRLVREPRVCRHLHLSLQSGCTATLRRMRRPYTAAAFAALRARLGEAVPGLAMTTDVIVGFPGETDAEFEQSLAFVESMDFARIHVFPYSVRPGTAAARMPNPVVPAVRAERMARMQTVAARAEQSYAEAWVGAELEVLWETREGDLWHGHADTYVRVFSRSSAPLRNTISRVRVTAVRGEGVDAVIL